MKSIILLIALNIFCTSFKATDNIAFCLITKYEKKHKLEIQVVGNVDNLQFQTVSDLTKQVEEVKNLKTTLEVIQFMVNNDWELISHTYDSKKRMDMIYFSFKKEKVLIIDPQKSFKLNWRFLWN